MSEQLEAVVEKEKVIVSVKLPRGGVAVKELANMFFAINDAMPSFEVVTTISTSSQSA